MAAAAAAAAAPAAGPGGRAPSAADPAATALRRLHDAEEGERGCRAALGELRQQLEARDRLVAMLQRELGRLRGGGGTPLAAPSASR